MLQAEKWGSLARSDYVMAAGGYLHPHTQVQVHQRALELHGRDT